MYISPFYTIKIIRGDGKFPEFDYSDCDKTENFLSSLSLNTSLNNNLDLSILFE